MMKNRGDGQKKNNHITFQHFLLTLAALFLTLESNTNLTMAAAIPKNTTAILKQLRTLMQNIDLTCEPLTAYIVPSVDAHNSEYPPASAERRAFVSGFDGSVGTAIITQKEALMWTDSRYHLQAMQDMDENWTLMKEGLPSVPTQGAWLSKFLPTGSNIGVDPNLITHTTWNNLKDTLESSGQKLVPVLTNLVDIVWTNKPPLPSNPVKPLPLKYSGLKISEKLKEIRGQMKEANATSLVVTDLAEIAWLLNMRGSDIKYNPMFLSYVIINQTGYTLYLDSNKVSDEVKAHLNEESGEAFHIKGYNEISEDIKEEVRKTQELIWISDLASYALTNLIPSKKLKAEMTPLQLMKAIKNPVEINGMRNAHIKDAVALCCYFAWLERELQSNRTVTEISGAKKLREFRAQQKDFVGDSFGTISAVGEHGAIIHYQPKESTDVPITTKTLYLCDSGGQYFDGTTDVTRTFHFGQPTEFQKEAFTRVLKGQILMMRSVFPYKIKGNCLDSFARRFLWDVGLDYAHGTGHGIGSYLSCHEGPIEISWRTTQQDPGLQVGMFVSAEPGYYETGQFGIRIEDIVQIVLADTPHNFNNRNFITLESITFCPKQTKLIDRKLLTLEEIQYIDDYHRKCWEIVSPLLEKRGEVEALEWLRRETQPIGA